MNSFFSFTITDLIVAIATIIGMIYIPIYLRNKKIKEYENKKEKEKITKMAGKIDQIYDDNIQFGKDIEELKKQKIMEDAEDKIFDYKYTGLLDSVNKLGNKLEELYNKLNTAIKDIDIIKRHLKINGYLKNE
jgi:hypothetical protein